jgi:hypothetical protein
MSSLLSDNISLKTWRLKGSEDWLMWKQEISVILESQDLWELTDAVVDTAELKEEELKTQEGEQGEGNTMD